MVAGEVGEAPVVWRGLAGAEEHHQVTGIVEAGEVDQSVEVKTVRPRAMAVTPPSSTRAARLRLPAVGASVS